MNTYKVRVNILNHQGRQINLPIKNKPLLTDDISNRRHFSKYLLIFAGEIEVEQRHLLTKTKIYERDYKVS